MAPGSPLTVGVLHPGQMGASVAAALVERGHNVCWVGEGRSPATRTRARKAGLRECAFADLGTADMLISVCPPHAAADVAGEALATGFRGLYLDVNPLSPAHKHRLCEAVLAAGAQFVDGGIVGPPAWSAGTTRLFLSGPRAAEVGALFEGSVLETKVVGEYSGAASALKIAYAAYTKGSTALIANIFALAQTYGIADFLSTEWERSQPDLAKGAARRVQGSADRAWRWVGEMEEIAATFREAGLPGDFHDGAAETYRRMAAFKDQSPPPGVDAIIAAVRDGDPAQ